MSYRWSKKIFHRCVIILIAFCLMVPLVPASSFEAEAANSTDYKIVGYYTSWSIYSRDFQVEDIDAANLTHINYAFADICWNGRHGNPSNDPGNPNPNTWPCTDPAVPLQRGHVPNGTIVLGEPWADVNTSFSNTLSGRTYSDCMEALCGNFEKLRRLKAEHPHLKTLISVGGWTWSNRFSDVAADPQARKVFADSAVAFIREYGFDGVDIDWEYPVEGGLPGNSARPEDKYNYTLLLQETRDALDQAGLEDGKQYLLTIASRAHKRFIETTEITKLAEILDWINVMTYDFHGGWENTTNFNSPLYRDPNDPTKGPGSPTREFNAHDAIQIYLDAGVPAHKLTLGLGFYGRGWTNCAPGPNGDGLYQTCQGSWDGKVVPQGTWDDYISGPTGVFDYGDIVANYENKNGFTKYWNDEAKVPYVYNPTNGIFIGYDDIDSITHKTDYIEMYQLAGAMFWELGSDCRVSPKYTCTGQTLLQTVAQNLYDGVSPELDTEPPTVPTNLQVTGTTSNSVSLTWNPSTDNREVEGYHVYVNGSKLTSSSGTAVTIGGLQPSTAYTIAVSAFDRSGNESALSSSISVTTDAPDTEAPTAPTNVVATNITDVSVTLSWDASTDNQGVAGYTVYHGETAVATTESTSVTVGGLQANTTYTLTVKAKDFAGNESAGTSVQFTTSDPLYPAWDASKVYVGGDRVSYNGLNYEARWWTQGETPGQSDVWKLLSSENGGSTSDNQPPTVPTNVSASNVTTSSVTLSWNASTDNVGVASYTVYSGGTAVATTTGTSVTVSGLSPNTTYTFTVRAKDAAGNESDASQAITVTTLEDSSGGGGGVEPWIAYKTYVAGDLVSYQGQTYECRQNHTSLPGWEPPAVPALWILK